MLGLSGFFAVFGLSKSSGIIQAMGEGPSDVWATTLMIGGWGALASAIAAKKARKPEHNLRLEKIFCIALFLNLSFFVYMTLLHFGPRGFSSVMFASTFALGFLFRAVQLFLERRLIKRAREHPEPADPVMADPRDDSVR
jgi:hypothetical protein